jgi:tetratricopeptide (TPR) repeat protein
MLIALAIVQALAATGPQAAAPQDQARLDACIAQVETDADAAYESAMAWAREEHAREARWCAAQALVKIGRVEEAARRFDGLGADQGWAEDNRLDSYSQAGNAWLLAGDGAKAKASFDNAVRMSESHPDALIDRARALAMLRDWPRAEEDLNTALDKRANDALALLLRATVRMNRGAYDLAVKDAEDATRADPRNVDALLVLGQTREAKRLGKAP